MNDTLSTIATRYSCRDYSHRTVTDAVLNTIAQAAIQAPSGMNRQNWHIIVVKNQELLAQMEGEGLHILSTLEDKSLYERIMSRGGKLFYNAPCMILIAVKQAYPPGAETMDCGIVAQNVVLAATSLGVDNVHCGFTGLAFAGSRAAEFKEKLKFPECYECGIGVLLGYANQPVPPHTPDQGKITIIE